VGLLKALLKDADKRDLTKLDEYRAVGGYEALAKARAMTPERLIEEMSKANLRGRGGAGFPIGRKASLIPRESPKPKYVVVNADESEPGAFKDRQVMGQVPHRLIEGCLIAAHAIESKDVFVYIRGEYLAEYETVQAAVDEAEAAGLFGDVRVVVHRGAGAYICGEETSMLESLEGRRGEVRVRPPLPAIKGLFGMPTVVNNVVSLATVPVILARGAAFYRDFGVGQSRGTLPVQLAGNIRRGGLVELAFGPTLRELLEDFGGGSASGRPLRAVQVGGPLGAYLPASQFDTPLDYEALSGIGALLGHGGVVAFDDTVDMARMARFAMQFCAYESCGKCTPCRIGSTRGAELIERIMRGEERERNLRTLEDLCETMQHGSLCGLGGMTPFPVRSAMQHFPEDFTASRAN
jgi:formate dehydrogenase iron-sulfur subunit